jgi:hypothetical protein
LTVSLVSHAGPTEPELPPDELLLDDELLVLPLEPELPDDPEEPLEPLELVVEPVSGIVDESATVVPLSSSVPGVLVGSVVVFAPASGVGSADFVSWTALPTSSAGEVAHAEARATSDNAATAMRLERRMAGTLAAELCTLPEPQRTRRSGDSYVYATLLKGFLRALSASYRRARSHGNTP